MNQLRRLLLRHFWRLGTAREVFMLLRSVSVTALALLLASVVACSSSGSSEPAPEEPSKIKEAPKAAANGIDDEVDAGEPPTNCNVGAVVAAQHPDAGDAGCGETE